MVDVDLNAAIGRAMRWTVIRLLWEEMREGPDHNADERMTAIPPVDRLTDEDLNIFMEFMREAHESGHDCPGAHSDEKGDAETGDDDPEKGDADTDDDDPRASKEIDISLKVRVYSDDEVGVKISSKAAHPIQFMGALMGTAAAWADMSEGERLEAARVIPPDVMHVLSGIQARRP